ncbi:hypothetical protein ACHAXS_002239 [Conticribra weissflogii]
MTAFFTNYTFTKGFLYSSAVIYVVLTAIAVSLQPFLPQHCPASTASASISYQTLKFDNTFYHHDPCFSSSRYPHLMYLTPLECTYGRHMVIAVILGSIIGYERREADRPAGIRTMGLVSLASCLFTINSVFAFMIGPFHWDPARVSAAIPSGVGFLGAGLIVKHVDMDELTGEKHHNVKGLNTAASIWLSAAVGAACGGGMYFVASFTSALMLVLLRFGPRQLNRDGSVLGLPQRFGEGDDKRYHETSIMMMVDGKGDGMPSRRGSKAGMPSLNYD